MCRWVRVAMDSRFATRVAAAATPLDRGGPDSPTARQPDSAGMELGVRRDEPISFSAVWLT
jgi:hypothetical protein